MIEQTYANIQLNSQIIGGINFQELPKSGDVIKFGGRDLIVEKIIFDSKKIIVNCKDMISEMNNDSSDSKIFRLG